MANPRLPHQKAEVTGATVAHPGRHKARKAPKVRPLGEPFARLNEAQRDAWESFRSELPWLNHSHRALLEAACHLRARFHAGEEVGVNAIQAYSAILSKLGATPVDETRLNVADEDERSPEDDYFN